MEIDFNKIQSHGSHIIAKRIEIDNDIIKAIVVGSGSKSIDFSIDDIIYYSSHDVKSSMSDSKKNIYDLIPHYLIFGKYKKTPPAPKESNGWGIIGGI
jgi:hypothetical protein